MCQQSMAYMTILANFEFFNFAKKMKMHSYNFYYYVCLKNLKFLLGAFFQKCPYISFVI